jgi:hypothetical protein
LRGADLGGADLRGDTLEKANLEGANLWGADFRGAVLFKARLEKTNLSNVKSLYKAKFDPEILSKIKAECPEKLATIWDNTKKGWITDTALLEQIKKPDWRGWPEEKSQGK